MEVRYGEFFYRNTKVNGGDLAVLLAGHRDAQLYLEDAQRMNMLSTGLAVGGAAAGVGYLYLSRDQVTGVNTRADVFVAGGVILGLELASLLVQRSANNHYKRAVRSYNDYWLQLAPDRRPMQKTIVLNGSILDPFGRYSYNGKSIQVDLVEALVSGVPECAHLAKQGNGWNDGAAVIGFASGLGLGWALSTAARGQEYVTEDLRTLGWVGLAGVVVSVGLELVAHKKYRQAVRLYNDVLAGLPVPPQDRIEFNFGLSPWGAGMTLQW